MTTELKVKRYVDVNIFLMDSEHFLSQHETINSFVLATAHQAKQDKSQNYYCGTVWNKENDLVFAILGIDKSFFYISHSTDPKALGLLYNDIISSPMTIGGLQGYQLALQQFITLCESKQHMKFETLTKVWGYEIKQVAWSPKIMNIAKTCTLRLATAIDLPWLTEWTSAFLHDVFKDFNSMVHESVTDICKSLVDSNLLYIMCKDGVPVSMASGIRPLKGCSMGYVYTPPNHRKCGYGAACVSMTTEALLKKFEHVALFVDSDRDPSNNLYTRVGYSYIGEAGRVKSCSNS